MAQEHETLEALLDEIRESGSGGDADGEGGEGGAVSAGQVLDRFRHRSLGVLLALLGLITIMPVIGDIPGAAILCATLALGAIVRALRGRGGLWVPGFVRRRTIRRDRFERGIEAARPWLRRVDRLIGPRLGALVAGRGPRLAVVLSAAALALALYPLAFVPFGANAPGVGLLALGLGLMTGDGLLVLIGYGAAAATLYVLATAIGSGPW